MRAEELHKFIEEWKKLGKYPPSSAWPDRLQLSTDVWKKFSEIQRYTAKDNHEYGVNLFNVDGEILVTPFTRGNESNVNLNDSVNVKMESKDGINIEKKIFVNSKLIKSSWVKRSQIKDKLVLSHLFNVHTHPVHSESYSFFSGIDIRSFLSLNSMVMGLLTDRLWLVCKTDRSLRTLGENGESQIHYISHQIFSGRSDIDKLIQENLSNWGVVFYEGKMNQSLVKI